MGCAGSFFPPGEVVFDPKSVETAFQEIEGHTFDAEEIKFLEIRKSGFAGMAPKLDLDNGEEPQGPIIPKSERILDAIELQIEAGPAVWARKTKDAKWADWTKPEPERSAKCRQWQAEKLAPEKMITELEAMTKAIAKDVQGKAIDWVIGFLEESPEFAPVFEQSDTIKSLISGMKSKADDAKAQGLAYVKEGTDAAKGAITDNVDGPFGKAGANLVDATSKTATNVANNTVNGVTAAGEKMAHGLAKQYGIDKAIVEAKRAEAMIERGREVHKVSKMSDDEANEYKATVKADIEKLKAEELTEEDKNVAWNYRKAELELRKSKEFTEGLAAYKAYLSTFKAFSGAASTPALSEDELAAIFWDVINLESGVLKKKATVKPAKIVISYAFVTGPAVKEIVLGLINTSFDTINKAYKTAKMMAGDDAASWPKNVPSPAGAILDQIVDILTDVFTKLIITAVRFYRAVLLKVLNLDEDEIFLDMENLRITTKDSKGVVINRSSDGKVTHPKATEAYYKAISEAKLLVVFLPEDGLKSKQLAQEMHYAFEHTAIPKVFISFTDAAKQDLARLLLKAKQKEECDAPLWWIRNDLIDLQKPFNFNPAFSYIANAYAHVLSVEAANVPIVKKTPPTKPEENDSDLTSFFGYLSDHFNKHKGSAVKDEVKALVIEKWSVKPKKVDAYVAEQELKWLESH